MRLTLIFPAEDLYPEGKGHRREITTHIHLMPRLRMHGAILPLTHMYLWRGA